MSPVASKFSKPHSIYSIKTDCSRTPQAMFYVLLTVTCCDHSL